MDITPMRIKNDNAPEIDLHSVKVRRGEAGTIALTIPLTKGPKVLKIDLPHGVISTSGNEITLAPNLTHVNIPILVTKEATEGKVTFSLTEKGTLKTTTGTYSEYNIKFDQ
jgi:hypothetical protein